MMPPRPPTGGAQRPQFSLSDTEATLCPDCGSDMFQEAFFLRRLSRLRTGEAKDTIVTVPVLRCVKCGQPFEEMLPEELKKNKIQKAV